MPAAASIEISYSGPWKKSIMLRSVELYCVLVTGALQVL